jgi:ribosome-associated protein
MSEFIIKGEFIELIRLLKATGLSNTGGHAKIMVDEGDVQVNGQVESRKRRKLIHGDLVKVGLHLIKIKSSST